MNERDPQFDRRYRQEPRYSEQPSVTRQSRAIINQQRETLRAIPGRPPEMDFFEAALAESYQPPPPAVGYYCHTVPVEIIAAAGARPVRLDCGNPALAQQGDEWLSGEVCPLVKGAFAAIHDREAAPNRCAALVLPASCDAKRKMGELLADYRPVFTLNLPPEQDARAYGDMAVRELDRFNRFLRVTIGTGADRAGLLREIRAAGERTALLQALAKARADQPQALSFRDAMVIIQSLQAGADPAAWLENARKVLERVRAFKPGRPRLRPRIVLTGAPLQWPNFKLLNLVEETGADIIADTICSGFQSVVEPIRFEENSWSALLRALADRYIFSSPCPCFISQATRLSRILDLVAEHRADGVIHYGLRLCPLFDMEVPRLTAVLRDRNIPFINLRTDYSLEDTEQLRVRLEAFLETLVE